MPKSKVSYCNNCNKETVHHLVNRATSSAENDIVKDMVSNFSVAELSNNFYRCEKCGNIQRQ